MPSWLQQAEPSPRQARAKSPGDGCGWTPSRVEAGLQASIPGVPLPVLARNPAMTSGCAGTYGRTMKEMGTIAWAW